jgi:hypothetical protein
MSGLIFLDLWESPGLITADPNDPYFSEFLVGKT